MNKTIMLSQFTAVFSEESVNIEHMVNKSKGDYAYTVFDIAESKGKYIEKLKVIDGVLRVRVIK